MRARNVSPLPYRFNFTEPVRVIDQRFAISDYGVHHRIPARTHLTGNTTHRTALLAYLESDPAPNLYPLAAEVTQL